MLSWLETICREGLTLMLGRIAIGYSSSLSKPRTLRRGGTATRRRVFQ